MSTPALAFREITKEYSSLVGKRFRALDRFSLAVNQGEIFGFLGPNGAGKTTAIHTALGLLRLTSGSGEMLGRPFGDAGTRRRVGFLAENIAFYPMSPARVLRMCGRLNDVPERAIAERMKELLERTDLASVGRKHVNKFSRGMLQRVGLAQALINDPELLILDEPTSALDPAGRVLVRELLLDLKRRGKTVFLSSHLLSEVEAVCDRVAIIRKGRVIRQGSVSELLERSERFEIAARGVRACNFADVRCGNDGNDVITIPAVQQRQAIERIWSAGGEVISVNPVRRSLEELFLELTSDDEVKQ
jgi:ABC-2 type transport system ATP-binding protein